MDGIIFDVDGTLWDSTEAVARSWNQAIEENTDFSLSLTADWLKSLLEKQWMRSRLHSFLPAQKKNVTGSAIFALTMKIGRLKPITVFFTRMLRGHWKAFLRKPTFISSATASVDISKFF